MEMCIEVPQKTKNRTTIWSCYTTPKECKSKYKTGTYSFIATLFTINKLWNQWIKKLSYIYTMEYYSAIKKREIMLFSGKCTELEILMLNEISQAKKDKCHMFSLICGI
jgi:hypothetical protein